MCSAVSLIAGAVSFACTLTHDTCTDDERWTLFLSLCILDGSTDFVNVVTVDLLYVPSPRLVLLGGIFVHYVLHLRRELDSVGVVEHDEVAETESSGYTSGTLGNLFLHATV